MLPGQMSHQDDVKKCVIASLSYMPPAYDSDGKMMGKRACIEQEVFALCDDEAARSLAEVTFHHMCANSEDIALPPRAIKTGKGLTVRSIAVTRHWYLFYRPDLVRGPIQGFYWQ